MSKLVLEDIKSKIESLKFKMQAAQDEANDAQSIMRDHKLEYSAPFLAAESVSRLLSSNVEIAAIIAQGVLHDRVIIDINSLLETLRFEIIENSDGTL